MKRTVAGKDLWLAITSAWRPRNVDAMRQVFGPATWYVPDDQQQDYHSRGAATVPVTGSPPQGFVAARNAALEDAFAHSLPCVQLDDDVEDLLCLQHGRLRSVPFSLFISVILQRLSELTPGIRRAGVYPSTNAYYMSHSIHTRAFIVGAFAVTLPCELRCDYRVAVRDDYDYCLQHICRFGGILRNNDLTIRYHYRDNPGGVQSWNKDRQQLDVITNSRMKRKWGRLVRLNRKRPGEIVLVMPRGGALPVPPVQLPS